MKKISSIGEEEILGTTTETRYLSVILKVFLFITILTATSPLVYGLRINEIMYNPSQGEQPYNEWIEILNDGDEDVDLDNYTLCGKDLLPGYVDHASGTIHDEEGLILESGEYAMITDGDSGTEVYDNFDVDESSLAVHVDAGSLCSGLSVGETIILEKDEVIDEVTYADDAEAGYSLELIDGDFIQSADLGGTPGKENSQGAREEKQEREAPRNNEPEEKEKEGNEDDSDEDSDDSEDEDEEEDDDSLEVSFQASTPEKTQNLSRSQESKIVLNKPSILKGTEDIVFTKEHKLRIAMVYSFGGLIAVLIMLLALRKI